MERYVEEFTVKFLELLDKLDIFTIIWTTFKIIGLLIAIRVLTKLGSIVIDQLFKDRFNINEHMQIGPRRVDTLSKLLKNILSYSLYFVVGLTILDMFNVPIKAILGGAGILGLAVGFGAQDLVKDIVGGFFIIFEDQFAVGEYVEVGGKFGMVEEVGLRLTKIRDWTGELYLIPNGQVGTVTNYDRGSMRALVEIGVSYQDDLQEVIKVIEKGCERAYQDMAHVIDEKPCVQGITKLDANYVTVRVTGTTKDISHWMLERTLRYRIREELANEGAGAPFQHIVYINAEEDLKANNGVREEEANLKQDSKKKQDTKDTDANSHQAFEKNAHYNKVKRVNKTGQVDPDNQVDKAQEASVAEETDKLEEVNEVEAEKNKQDEVNIENTADDVDKEDKEDKEQKEQKEQRKNRENKNLDKPSKSDLEKLHARDKYLDDNS